MEKVRGITMVKKVSDRAQAAAIRERIEQNTWNPFERVDPKILEMLHRKHQDNSETTRRYLLLSQVPDALI